MKYASYFRSEWKDSYVAYKRGKSILYSGKGLLDRMPLSNGQYQPNSIDQQKDPKIQPIATHKLTCKASFDINLVSFFLIHSEKWLVNDWQKIGEDVYIVNLHSSGEYFEKA